MQTDDIELSANNTAAGAASGDSPEIPDEESGTLNLGCNENNVVSEASGEPSDSLSPTTKPNLAVPQYQYSYTDESGALAAIKVRDSSGNDIWYRAEGRNLTVGLGDVKPSLYHSDRLEKPNGVVFVFENENDVETAENLGFTATTSPYGTDTNWSKALAKPLAGLDVVIVTNNSSKSKNNGKNAMRTILRNAKSVKLISAHNIFPQAEYSNDFSDITRHLNGEGIKRHLINAVNNAEPYLSPLDMLAREDGVPEYLSMTESRNGTKIVVQPPQLGEYIKSNYNYFLVESSAVGNKYMIYLYANGVYNLISENKFKGVIKEALTQYDVSLYKSQLVDKVYKYIAREVPSSPVYKKLSDFNTDENIINFQNGILLLNTMTLAPHDPKYLSTIQLPCNYDPLAQSSPVFDKYLDDLTSGDKEVQKLLLQFMGVALSNVCGYRMKKALFIVGAGNSGKSQLRRLMDKLLGEDHVSSMDLNQLEDKFGTDSLVNWRVIGSPDMPFMELRSVSFFKILTGRDNAHSEAKYGGKSVVRYNGIVWMCGNDMPHLSIYTDRGDHVFERMTMVECNNVISEDKRDPYLLEKMYAERDAIVNKMIAALKTVIANGYKYDIPQKCLDAAKEFQKRSDTILGFMETCCEERIGGAFDGCTTRMVNEAAIRYSKENNNGCSLSTQQFRKELCRIYGVNNISDIEKKTPEGMRYYAPFTLKLEYRQ